MTVQLDHTIVASRDADQSAAWVAEMLGLPAPTHFGHFRVVEVDNGVSLDFLDTEGEISPQHYAFLVSEEEFDDIYGRLSDRGLDHWADPFLRRLGEINTNDGGRGVYWRDPDGHLLEIITRRYGSGG